MDEIIDVDSHEETFSFFCNQCKIYTGNIKLANAHSKMCQGRSVFWKCPLCRLNGTTTTFIKMHMNDCIGTDEDWTRYGNLL